MKGKLRGGAAGLLFRLSGGTGFYDNSPISRAMCELNCIRGQIT